MLFLYSLLMTLAFLVMSPLFLLRREKYAAGFKQRLGAYPEFQTDNSKVIWLHCVSVGETNAARPLVDQLLKEFPEHSIVVSTTTKTGQQLARKIFADKAGAVFYFPFDWKFSVRRALEHFKPSLVLLMETEIWPRFIHEAKTSGAKIAIVNGRLSEKSYRRYSKIRIFFERVLKDIDIALMQGPNDANRLISLGLHASKTQVTGNLKFDHELSADEELLTEAFRERFGITGQPSLIIAASTHDPEEKWIIESLDGILGHDFRLMIAPRHPERFAVVADLLEDSPYTFVRRSDAPSDVDQNADIVLLDSIGELRAAYPLADIVFVGGSLIPHGGQSILEPAALGKAIVTGPFTANFDAVVKEFLENDALLQLPESKKDYEITERLYKAFTELETEERRHELGQNAASVMGEPNRGGTGKTVEYLKPLFAEPEKN